MLDRRPLLFLDIDGVLNAWGDKRIEAYKKRYSGKEFEDPYIWGRYDQFLLAIPKHLPRLLREIHKRAEIVWLTTWRGDANILGNRLGLPNLKHLDGEGDYTEWKWPAAEEMAKQAIADGRMVVWIEDFGGSPMMMDAMRVGVYTIDTAETDFELTEATAQVLIDMFDSLD